MLRASEKRPALAGPFASPAPAASRVGAAELEPAALEFEPGRSIVAHAGSTIYEVLAIKRRGDGNIVVVDGGMADNPRPMLYGSYHHIVPVVAGGSLRPTTVFGRACESDYIGRVALPETLERGDLLVDCTTGAYTYSMASNYNAFPTPAVVAVCGDEHELWRIGGRRYSEYGRARLSTATREEPPGAERAPPEFEFTYA